MNDSLIEIKTLESEYATLISAYNEAYNNYKQILTNGQANDFIEIQGRSWWGTDGLTEGTVTSSNDCSNLCLQNTKCTGATFNPDNRYCWTRKGENTLAINTDVNINNVALITKLKSSLILLQNLNTSIMDINTRITDKFKKINPTLVKQQIDKRNKQKELDDNYNNLSRDKKEIQKLIDEYNSVEEKYSNGTLIVERNNSLFKLWFILACIVVVILFKVIYGDYLSYTFLFTIFIISLVIFYFYSG
jgi:hypothetical protein